MPNAVTITVDYNDGYTKPDTYEVHFTAGMDVEDAMKAAYSASAGAPKRFHFILQYYGDLGYFVESINGVQGNSVSSWALFLGPDETPVGIDEEILKEGDAVTFRYLLDKDIHPSVIKAKRLGAPSSSDV